MTNKKRQRSTLKASNMACTTVEVSRKKLADDFLAYLNRSWDQHANELLDRVYAERPQLYFKALVKLTLVLDSRFGQPMEDFDRRPNRQQVIQRLTRRDDWQVAMSH